MGERQMMGDRRRAKHRRFDEKTTGDEEREIGNGLYGRFNYIQREEPQR
jgi:hypothetical protein